ncbi:MAG: IMP cyclohydrolase / Phosphoribosylaminoimidazolecarboxamide formyltransferase, partial [uncultured Actinomycetospora sp.]
ESGDRHRAPGHHARCAHCPRHPATDPPRTGQRVRQGRPARPRHRAARGRRRDRLHGVDRLPDRRRGRPGDARGGGHRVPRVPRRAGQDAAPAGARGPARRHAPAHAHRGARVAGHRAVRPARGEPLPVHPDRRVGRVPGRLRRADRHRRAGDDPRRGQEPRVGRRRHRPHALRLGARAGPPGRRRAGRPAPARGRGVPAHRVLRHRRRLVDGQRARPRRRRIAVPWVGGHDRPAPRGAALRREPAPGRRALRRPGEPQRDRRRDAAARQGDVVQQLRRHRRGVARRARPRRRLRGDHQAREPLWDRGRHRRRRGAPAGPRLRPDQRVRRGDRRQHRGLDGHGRDRLGDLHRGDRRPVLRRRRGGDPGAQEEHPRAHRDLGAVAGRAARDLRRPAAPAARRDRRAGRRPRLLDPGLRRPRVARAARRPRLRVARLPRGEVQRDPARPRRRDDRRGHGPGQPRRRGQARGRARRRPRRGLRRRLGRVLPVPGRLRGARRRGRRGRRPARRVGARRAGDRGRAARRRDDVPHGHPPLRAL